MSKPISISFGKPKSSAQPTTPSSSTPTLPKPISLGVKPRNGLQSSSKSKPKSSALRPDSDSEDERPPVHEAVTGFSEEGIILSEAKKEKEALIIPNAGNGDWRTKGRATKNLLPEEVQRAKEYETTNGSSKPTIEKDEVSKVSGLQFAQVRDTATDLIMGDSEKTTEQPPSEPTAQTEDERALAALLNEGNNERKSNAVILQAENSRTNPLDETDDFRSDVAARPESCTLEEYAAMPVEEFGMAMLRGMGQKRKANGEIIKYGDDKQANGMPKIKPVRQGYLGIGAKAAPGSDELEIGAWGKADMRKAARGKGEGLYTPVMLKDKRTGEMITEQELERRRKEAKDKSNGKAINQDDWRDRRDRNLKASGRDGGINNSSSRRGNDDDYKDKMNGFSRTSSSDRDRRRDDDYKSKSAPRIRDRSSSRDRDRKYREGGDKYQEHEERKRDKHYYDYHEKHKSSRTRDRDRGGMDEDTRRHRDRDR